ncbi:cytochrome C oxidase subunit IV family protein [Chengkuizengella marina]|uniref:Cytochrome C oxidase subunit IV n=1 Tax=Chengkuizengella marina TaxID=2507566 RepID=A0A6N9Q5B5_9BACL|nr:cytochrome C oxidase subunit IV family protein [Chengkuizengella marina]NBI30055.1 cytochrome C oxidase subunit IV [Chengkuizengella marina]
MEANQEQVQDRVKRGTIHEGPKNHIIAFVISIFLTLLAFMAVANTALDATFIKIFIVILAIFQAVIQLAFWMHMKDRGHFFQILFLATGTFVAITAFIMAIYWVWW